MADDASNIEKTFPIYFLMKTGNETSGSIKIFPCTASSRSCSFISKVETL